MHSRDIRESTKSSHKPTESSNKKSQHSKRYRKASTSSNDSSDEEKVTKRTHTKSSRNGSPDVDKQEPDIKTSKLNESMKHSGDKSHRSSSSRRSSRKKSHTDEDSRTSVKTSRIRGHSDECTQEDKTEDGDDKTYKGKSKSKHRSKNEKQLQIQDIQAKSESEISENVQVTLQSPHSNIDIPVDNETEHDEKERAVPLRDISDNISAPITDSYTKRNSTSDSNDSKEYQQHKYSETDETSQNLGEGTGGETNKSEGNMEWQSVEQEIVLDVLPVHGDSEVLDYQEEVLQAETSAIEGSSNGNSEHMGHAENRSKSSSPEAGMSVQTSDHNNAPLNKSSSNIPPQSDDDSRSVDAIILHESSNTPPRDHKFSLSQSFQSDVHHIENVNNEIQDLKKDVVQIFESRPKPERKHKWGNSLVGLEFIKPSMKNITINTIKEFCPNVAFLDENEIRLASEHREKKVERRISIEYKSDEDSSRKYDTQSSHEETNSEIDNSNIIALNRKISIVEDTASKLRPPPSPARNPISPVLYISNLVRPFTLKQLKELLERTGRIKENGFWTDRIKSKCYVHYESSEEAEATRNALHRVNWPIGNGKQLMIEYSTPDDFEKARNPAPTPAALEKPSHKEKENKDLDKQVSVKRQKREEPERVLKEREGHRSEGHNREWGTSREEIHNRRSHSRRHSQPREVHHGSRDQNDRRRNRRSATPPGYRSKKQKMKEEEPQKLMDDLFHKTKAAPSVYWLPLTPEEIATKQQERLLRMAEHKRRIEESARNRGDHGRGAPYRRRYD